MTVNQTGPGGTLEPTAATAAPEPQSLPTLAPAPPRAASLRLIAGILIFAAAPLAFIGCHSTRSTTGPLPSKPSKLDGQQAPPFTLPSDTGTEISSSDFAGKSKLVLVFFRGYW